MRHFVVFLLSETEHEKKQTPKKPLCFHLISQVFLGIYFNNVENVLLKIFIPFWTLEVSVNDRRLIFGGNFGVES